jgi:hypothetical protein
MKIIITENQYKRLFEEKEEKILNIPGLHYFNNDWNLLMDFLNSKGNPKWKISDSLDLYGNKDVVDLNNLISVGGYLDLYGTNIESLRELKSVGGSLYLGGTNIESLGELKSVGGFLNLEGTKIESLGELQSVGGYLDLGGANIESLGELKSVGGSLYLGGTNIESLGELQSVGADLYLSGTPLSKKYTREEIRKMVKVDGNIYM